MCLVYKPNRVYVMLLLRCPYINLFLTRVDRYTLSHTLFKMHILFEQKR